MLPAVLVRPLAPYLAVW